MHVSHDRAEESFEAKARWFQTLTMDERLDYLFELMDMMAENDNKAVRPIDVSAFKGCVQILRLP